jgi:hypothetical protein
MKYLGILGSNGFHILNQSSSTFDPKVTPMLMAATPTVEITQCYFLIHVEHTFLFQIFTR